jgi:hypothetical protein
LTRRTITNDLNIIKGTVHGKSIELERESGFPDGQQVSVTLFASPPAGEGMRQAFGSWADDAAELESFLSRIREDRKLQRGTPGL